MVFQATKWGWKRIAARLLLVPVLAGGVATAHAQTRAAAGGTPAGTPVGQSRPAPAGDPKGMLKDGRKALAEGRFNDARDLAQRAESSNPGGKWGLFDDTPNALRKDVDSAQAKAQKGEVDRLVKQAKSLLAKPTGSDAERAANLDTALQMARRADQLHGPAYSVWDLGDRPDKLVKEIEADRTKLRLPVQPGGTGNTPAAPFAATLPPAGSPSGVRPAVGTGTPGASGVVTANAAGTGTGSPSGVVPAAGARTFTPATNATAGVGSPVAPTKPGAAAPKTLPPPPDATALTGPVAPTAPPKPDAAPDAKKTAALKLMAEGKQLADSGDFAAAHAKYTEAGKLGAAFGEKEPNPGFAVQELNARGVAAIDRLVRESGTQIGKKDFVKAEAALDAASEIATALSLFPRPIEEAKTALRVASGGKHGGVPPGGLSPAGGPESLVHVGTPAAPVAPLTPSAPAGVARVGGPATPVEPTAATTTPPAAGGSVTGRQLLDQAALAFRKGDFDAARTLALQAHNQGGPQDEARGLLNQIDAEVFAAKQRTAAKSLDAAAQSAQDKDHSHALGVLVLIDPNLLSADGKAKREQLIAGCKAEIDKAGNKAGVVAAGAQVPTGSDAPVTNPYGTVPPAATNPPGTARVGTGAPPTAADVKATNPDNLTTQVDSLRRVAFQKLRSEGLKLQADAQAAFGRGETDVAIQMLTDYANRVRAANLEPASVALLLRPVDSRLEMFRVMKGQADALAREKKEKAETRELITGRGAAEEQRKAEVQRLVRRFHELVKNGSDANLAEAERVAMQAKQLDPDDAGVGAMAHMVKITRRVREAEKLKSDKAEFFLDGLNAAERPGAFVDSDNPLSVKIEAVRRAHRRGGGDDTYLRTQTPKEFEIQMKLDQPVSVEFTQTPLSEAIENIRTLTGLPFSYDTDSLAKEGVSTAVPVSEKLPSISARNALHLVLSKAGLSFVVEHEVVRITTLKMVKGRLFTKVFSVADLVTPIPNYALPDFANIDKMMKGEAGGGSKAWLGGAGAPPGLGGGTAPAGTQAAMPGIAGDVKYSPRGSRGGSLEANPLAGSATLASDSGTKHEQLIKLITSMVRPYSWDGPHGGNGKIEYFDLGSALVVNQTADVIQEIRDLLESLRRLQDLAVAVEVRIISLGEAWFERMGVDFAMNIKTNNTRFEPQLTSNTFRPQPFINDINAKGTTVGLLPAGAGGSANTPGPTFTPDLDVPFRATSFSYGVPTFGQFPGTVGQNGGVSLGLAFLNDIQVYMFMEAAQGDRRSNIMQAPKLTLFNGQTATLAVNNTEYLVTGVSVIQVNGQLVYVPQNSPQIGGGGLGINLTLQAVVSADRRFVRINAPINLGVQTGATVPLFPVTTFITPVFEGGSQGQPVPFTQFFQQPSFTTLSVQTTVVCPDGGTVLLGGLKTLGESRNEFGPPVLSKIPYLNRLFKNVGIGRETLHVMIMITPRIIITSEEEINQTEVGSALGARPGQ